MSASNAGYWEVDLVTPRFTRY